MSFIDRADAGRRLATRLGHLAGDQVVVLGLPRGGVPVACEVARALHAPLDVVLVRKLGVPFQPELAMGAIGEDGARVVNWEVTEAASVTDDQLQQVEDRERRELDRRARRFRSGRPRVPVEDRTVIVVDDGLATGSTARAACMVVRDHGAARVVLAVPVAPRGWEARIDGAADELVALATPEPFFAIGQFYEDFSQTSDDEVVRCLQRAAQEAESAEPREAAGSGRSGGGRSGGGTAWLRSAAGATTSAGGAPSQTGPVPPTVAVAELDVVAGTVLLGARLAVPAGARAVVAFAHGSGSSRHSPRNRAVAEELESADLATLLVDLLTSDEAADRLNVFDIELLARRLTDVTRWLADQPATARLPVAYFGASTGAGAALWAAASPDCRVFAVVSRGGRPDLAGPRLSQVVAPTLLIVGGMDDVVLRLNQDAQSQLGAESRLVVVPGATHLFEEPGALEQMAGLARDWFLDHLPWRKAV